MLSATRRRLGSSAGLAVGLIIFVPALAEAQLFPNRTIRREKPSCAAENPFNAHVRRDYFGYYPTCWSKFPEGWACPCPNSERPDAKQNFLTNPPKLNSNPPGGDPGFGADPDNPTDPDGAMTTKPGTDLPVPPPRGGSVFDLPNDPATTPKPPPRTGPGAGRPADPFTDPDPAAPLPTNPGNTRPPVPGGRPGGTSTLMEMPSLPATSPTASTESRLLPGSMALAPDATLASTTDSNLRPDLGPLPSAPTPTPYVSGSTTNSSDNVIGAPTAAPAQAPRRRSLLGTLFGRGNTQTR